MKEFVEQFMVLKAGVVKGEVIAENPGGEVFGLWDGAVWQLITYQFMHFGLWHV